MNKNSYTIFSYEISIIIIPKCCSQYSGQFYFSSNSPSLFKDSLIFYCPKCKVCYPKSHDLFLNFILFNRVLSHFNAELDETKKSGIRVVVATLPLSYAILDSMINFENAFDGLSRTDDPYYEKIQKEAETRLEIYAQDSQPKQILENGIKLGPLSIYCNHCESITHSDDGFLNQGKFICPTCQNSQKFKKKQLKDLLYYYDGFQKSIDIVNESNLFVIPFSLSGAYEFYRNNDNNFFKDLNDIT